jgi:hypothetical protein
LLVLSFVEFFETAVENFAFELRDQADQTFVEFIKEESNELKGCLRDGDVFVFKDDCH